MRTVEMLTVGELKNILDYNPGTGIFRWKVSKSGIKRIVAGHNHPNGYVHITINGRYYGAHRLAWLYMTGEWPPCQVDHKNRVGTDNSWSNLRLATVQQNSVNRGPTKKNKLGVKGVRLTANNTYEAFIWEDDRSKHLGCFKTCEEARLAYLRMAKKMHGEYVPQ